MPHLVLDSDDLSASELTEILATAADLKHAAQPAGQLSGHSLGLLFEKSSTRTRVSFETGMTQLGGHAVFLDTDQLQLGRGEPWKDTARALSQYVQFLVARVTSHARLNELATYASVPVINGLTKRAHPAQALADMLMITELFEDPGSVTLAWVGDGNNVARSLALCAAMLGVEFRMATPPAYRLSDGTIEQAAAAGPRPEVVADPTEAVTGADVIYTDVWAGIGHENDGDRRRAFADYQVDAELVAAGADPVVMHCLPAHRGEEITDEVLESKRSVVWQQAANRLHAQKGLLVWLARRGPH